MNVAQLPREALVRPWLLALTLGLLHIGLLHDVTTVLGRGLLIGHLGAALLWQPLVRGDHRISLVELLVCVGITALLGFWMSWGLALVWVLLLAGLIGAKLFVYARPRERLPYWLALTYLVLALIGLILPELLPNYVQPEEILRKVVSWLSPALLISMLVLGAPRADEADKEGVDFVGSLVIVLVLSGFLLGALVIMFLEGTAYVLALVQALGIMAAGLLLLGLAWNPGKSFMGLGLAVSRRVLSGGFPFDRWLSDVADIAMREQAPNALVERAVAKMMGWPGITGIMWELAEEEHNAPASGMLGLPLGQQTRLRHGNLDVTLHTMKPLGPTPLWQFDLMIRVLAEFHSAKVQAVRVTTMSYLKAVHETGARVTHEVKNLLQSLDMVCFAMQEAQSSRRSDALDLAARQLPAISERLHQALSRIREPIDLDFGLQPAEGWWTAFRTRYTNNAVVFRENGDLSSVTLPGAVFDTAADNLVRNAMEKLQAGAALRVEVRFDVRDDGCVLTVEDDGKAIDDARARKLFRLPVESASGFGIGLYQASRVGRAGGYEVKLDENRDGCVRFTLAPAKAFDPKRSPLHLE